MEALGGRRKRDVILAAVAMLITFSALLTVYTNHLHPPSTLYRHTPDEGNHESILHFAQRMLKLRSDGKLGTLRGERSVSVPPKQLHEPVEKEFKMAEDQELGYGSEGEEQPNGSEAVQGTKVLTEDPPRSSLERMKYWKQHHFHPELPEGVKRPLIERAWLPATREDKYLIAVPDSGGFRIWRRY